MTEWQTPVTKILLVKCHGCKVPPEGYTTPTTPQRRILPTFIVNNKNILLIESSRYGFISSCPMSVIHSDGTRHPNPREPLHNFLANIANTGGTLTFRDVIHKFSRTIIPSNKKKRDKTVSYQLSVGSNAVARVKKQTSSQLVMNESLLFGTGAYCDQGIFATTPGVNPTVENVHSRFDLIDVHEYSPADLGMNPVDFRHLGNGQYLGQMYPVKGTIGDPVLLSEILNNPSIDDGTAILVIACKSMCDDAKRYMHSIHDVPGSTNFGLPRTASVQDSGTLTQVITNDAPDPDSGNDSADGDDDDGDAAASRKKIRIGGKTLNKFTLKKPKHKTRKTKPKTKKRRKRNNNKNKNKNNNNKKRTVSASSSAVK